jgi:three-Cys-motif partner protein
VTQSPDFEFDEIGYWSEVKLDILHDYAAAYSRILASQRDPRLCHLYIDGFAGAGIHISKSSGAFVAGSPLIALQVAPPFCEYHLIDLAGKKVAALRALAGDNPDVRIYHGDCNKILLEKVLPRARYEDFRRALCVLDPYGLHLDWRVIAMAGAMKSVEIFLNFPVADINRNVLWHRREGVSAKQDERLTRYWGDDSWKEIAYRPSVQMSLLGDSTDEKAPNVEIATAFRERLVEVAGFKHVPAPIAMRNRNGAVVYYLYFASQKPVAEGIVKAIFKKYRDRGGI